MKNDNKGTIFFNEGTINYFHNEFNGYINDGDWCIDIGSNIGCATAAMQKLTPNGKIICFEATQTYISDFNKNIKNKENIDVYNLICSDVYDVYEFSEFVDNGAVVYSNDITINDKVYHISYDREFRFKHPNSVTRYISSIDTCDYILKTYTTSIHNIKFIKLDTEGMDFVILHNLKPLLDKIKPIVYAEWYKPRLYDDFMFDVIDYIGYRAINLDSKNSYVKNLVLYPN